MRRVLHWVLVSIAFLGLIGGLLVMARPSVINTAGMSDGGFW